MSDVVIIEEQQVLGLYKGYQLIPRSTDVLIGHL
jgi:hypothetical protein